MPKGPELYDLRLFATRLPDGHGKVKRALNKWLNAHSVSTDLLLARDFIDSALRHHLAGEANLNHAKTALLQTSIIYYARALERHSDHRETLRLGELMTDEQKTMHARLVNLRDEALAHFGPAGVGKPWNEDHAVLIIEGRYWQSALVCRRSLFDKEFALELIRHLDAIGQTVIQVTDKRRATFERLLHEAVEQSQEVSDALLSCAMTEEDAGALHAIALEGDRRGHKIVEGAE